MKNTKKFKPGKFPSAVQIKLFSALSKHAELYIGNFLEHVVYSATPFEQYVEYSHG